MKMKDSEIFKKLQEKDYRLTDIRKSVIKILINNQHVSINEIINELKKENASVNVMSIYNTIDLLLEEHIIHGNIFENKQVFYELISESMIHIFCSVCHKIVHFGEKVDNLSFLNLKKLKSDLLKNKDFEFSHFNVEVHGICSGCKNKIKKT